jgi:predicted hydrolase (HD superfamily)
MENTGTGSNPPTFRDRLIAAMREVFGADQRRIDHALAVLGHAEAILAAEGGDAEVVTAAAILHDIGIQQAEQRHGSPAAHWQELEGPPIARDILRRLDVSPEIIEHVCRIVANHHSARDIDTPEFRIIWDADWIVNLPDLPAGADRAKLQETIRRVFKTPAGRERAGELYLKGKER